MRIEGPGDRGVEEIAALILSEDEGPGDSGVEEITAAILSENKGLRTGDEEIWRRGD